MSWEPSNNITLYKNDGSGTYVNVSSASGVPPINNIVSQDGKGSTGEIYDWTREGYNFIEWNTSADGTGTTYAIGTVYPKTYSLYAIWESSSPQQSDTKVHFRSGIQSEYDNLNSPDNNSLYFITDTHKIYKGETLLATLNDDYIINNTENDIVVSLNNGVLSAELRENVVADIEDLSNEWGEIPSAIVPYDIESNVYYDLYYIGGNNIVYDDSNNNKYFKDGDNYYKTTSTEWNLRETKSGTSSQKILLGSNIENIVHEIYSGNDPAYLCSGIPEPAGQGPITPGPGDIGDIIIK